MRALDAALAAEWAMDELWIRQVLEIAAREHEPTPQLLEAYRGRAVAEAERLTIRGNVGIVTVRGPMFRYANLFTEVSGATSYDTIRRDLQVAVDYSAIEAIVLNVDSPGGEANGVAELARAVRAASERKRVVAYGGGTMASAAYWIASAASEIVIAESAILGSIGVRIAVIDDRQARASRGVKEVEFVSSQSPGKALDLDSDDGRARIQRRADALAQVFIDAVAANRGVTSQEVIDRFGGGDVKVGQAAVDAGMADRLGSFETLIGELSRDPTGRMSSSSKGVTMSDAKTTAAPAVTETGITQGALDQAVAKAREAAIAEGRAAGAEAERKRIAAIDEAAVPGYADLVAAAKADPEGNAATLAVSILKRQKEQAASVIGNRQADDAALAAVKSTPLAAPAAAPAKPAVKQNAEGWREEYEASEELQAEFPSVESYLGFKQGEKDGRVHRLTTSRA